MRINSSRWAPMRWRRAGMLASLVVAISSGIVIGCGGDPTPTGQAPAYAGGMEVSYSFNAADKRELVAFADNVFVGRVTKQVGNVSLPTSSPDARVPESQFAVEVIDNIKGRLQGTVKVSQFGGPVDVVVERGGERVTERKVDLIEGDPLLKPGELVLLATRPSDSGDGHTIVAQPFADRRIRGRAERDRLVREFTQAREAQRAR